MTLRFAFPVFAEARKTLLAWAPFMRRVGNPALYIGDEYVFQDWDPTLSAGTMTLTDVRIFIARYVQVGKMVHISFYATFTTGGVATNTVFFTVPKSARAQSPGVDGQYAIVQIGQAAGPELGTLKIAAGSDLVTGFRPGGVNWTLGANRLIVGNFFYEAN